MEIPILCVRRESALSPNELLGATVGLPLIAAGILDHGSHSSMLRSPDLRLWTGPLEVQGRGRVVK